MLHFLHTLLGKKMPRRYDQILEVIRQRHPSTIMEIGVLTGHRARTMIDAAFCAGERNPKYYGFDLFEKMDDEKFKKEVSKQPLTMEEIQAQLETTGADIHLFKGDTTHVLPEVWEQLPKMDLIFIDGGHSIETIRNDWIYSSKLLSPSGVIIFDDYWHNRTDVGAKVVADAIDRTKYEVELMPVVDKFTNPEFGPLTIQLVKVSLR